MTLEYLKRLEENCFIGFPLLIGLEGISYLDVHRMNPWCIDMGLDENDSIHKLKPTFLFEKIVIKI